MEKHLGHDHSEWQDGRLTRRSSELSEALRGGYLVGDRLEQVKSELGLIAFEMAERLRETKEQQIEEAWSEHEEDNNSI